MPLGAAGCDAFLSQTELAPHPDAQSVHHTARKPRLPKGTQLTFKVASNEWDLHEHVVLEDGDAREEEHSGSSEGSSPDSEGHEPSAEGTYDYEESRRTGSALCVSIWFQVSKLEVSTPSPSMFLCKTARIPCASWIALIIHTIRIC